MNNFYPNIISLLVSFLIPRYLYLSKFNIPIYSKLHTHFIFQKFLKKPLYFIIRPWQLIVTIRDDKHIDSFIRYQFQIIARGNQ